jgi:hypothetical protein
VTDVRPPGWYDDPSGEPSRLRWWDGSAWSGIDRARMPHERPAGVQRTPDILDSDASPGSPRLPGRWLVVLLAVVLIGLLVLTGRLPGLGGGGPTGSVAASGTSEPTAEPGEPPATEPPVTGTAEPAPTSAAPTPSPRPVSGRFTDPLAGMSYDVLPGSWRAWDMASFGGLVRTAGYYRVVQPQTPDGGLYWANVTSGPVTGGGPRDLRGAGHRLAAFLDAGYYPPHTRRNVVERATTVDGRTAYLLRWLAVFEPKAAGYLARSELVVVLVVDVGRDRPSALYISLPDPVRSAWPSVDGLLASVRVLR